MSNDVLVPTPGGYRPRSQVHLVERGAVLKFVDERVQKINAAGELIADLGSIPRKQTAEALMPGNVTRRAIVAQRAADLPGLGDGWITYADWKNSTGQPISSFSTAWVVPSEPGTSSGQLIYLFSGIQNSTMIYQPVLQWGTSSAGGGAYWSVASWYVDGQNGKAFHTAAQRVSPGDVLVGIMTLTGQSAGGFSYDCEFQGMLDSRLTIQGVEELTWCIETLEAYQVTKCTDYPANARVRFTEIAIACRSLTPKLSWNPVNVVTDCGQHAVVVSDSATSGAIDLWFRAEPSATFDIAVDVTGLESDGCGHSFGRLGTQIKLTAQVVNFQGPYPYESLEYQWGQPQGAAAGGLLNAQSVTLNLNARGTAKISVTATAKTIDGTFTENHLIQIAVVTSAEIGVWTRSCNLRNALRFIPQPIPIGDPYRAARMIAENPISARQISQLQDALAKIDSETQQLRNHLGALARDA